MFKKRSSISIPQMCHPHMGPAVWEEPSLSIISESPLSQFSCLQVVATPWTVAHQAPLPMGFSRQEYWSGLPCPPPGDLPNPGIEPASPALQVDSLLLRLLGSLRYAIVITSPCGVNKYFSCVGRHFETQQLFRFLPHFGVIYLGQVGLMGSHFTSHEPFCHWASQVVPGSGRSSGGGHGNPLQCSCWRIPRTEKPDGLVHGVTKSWTRLRRCSMHTWRR